MAAKEKVCKQVRLWCHEGTSDKVYDVIVAEIGRRYTVTARWGRRGGTLREQVKWHGASRDTATARARRLVLSKIGRGYERMVADD